MCSRKSIGTSPLRSADLSTADMVASGEGRDGLRGPSVAVRGGKYGSAGLPVRRAADATAPVGAQLRCAMTGMRCVWRTSREDRPAQPGSYIDHGPWERSFAARCFPCSARDRARAAWGRRIRR
jgi:hypothetical protein